MDAAPVIEDETCPDCNEDCGHLERGFCVDDECPTCGEWIENCDCKHKEATCPDA